MACITECRVLSLPSWELIRRGARMVASLLNSHARVCGSGRHETHKASLSPVAEYLIPFGRLRSRPEKLHLLKAIGGQLTEVQF